MLYLITINRCDWLDKNVGPLPRLTAFGFGFGKVDERNRGLLERRSRHFESCSTTSFFFITDTLSLLVSPLLISLPSRSPSQPRNHCYTSTIRCSSLSTRLEIHLPPPHIQACHRNGALLKKQEHALPDGLILMDDGPLYVRFPLRSHAVHGHDPFSTSRGCARTDQGQWHHWTWYARTAAFPILGESMLTISQLSESILEPPTPALVS